MHDVPLCSLVHKGRHGVEARKQVGKPKTDTVQGRALKHQMFLVSHTVAYIAGIVARIVEFQHGVR